MSMLWLAAPAAAQQAPAAEEPVEVVVTGARAENRTIVQQKRDTDGIADFLGADEAGQLPDLNIAESLRRIPGVTSIFDEDRGRFVTVRGLTSSLNYVTVDGIAIATTDSFGGTGRKVNLEVIPSSAVGLLEVRKTFTPEVDGGSIGGYVKLHTRSAFDTRTPLLLIEGGVNYQSYNDVPSTNNYAGRLDGHFGGQFDITYADRFGADDQFGFVLSGHYKQDQRDESKNIQASELYFSSAGAVVSPTLPDGTVNPAWNGLVAPAEVRSYDYTNRVRDYGGLGKFEYREGGLHLSLLGFYYAEGQQETRNTVQLLSLSTISNQTATSGDLRIGDARIGWNRNNLDRENYGAIFAGEWVDDRHAVNLTAGWTYNNFDDFQPLIDYRGSPANALRGIHYDVVTSGPARNEYALANPQAYLDPAIYQLRGYAETRRYSQEKVYDARFDYAYNQAKGDEGFGFGAGFEYRRIDRMRDNDTVEYVPDRSVMTPLALQTDFQPNWVNFPLLWVDGRKFLAEKAGLLPVNATNTLNRSTQEDFRYVEDSMAAYGMISLTGERYKFVGGVRYETVDTLAVTPGESLTAPFLRRSGNYDKFLPSATFAYDLARDLRLKLGASRSLGRPDPGDVAQRERRDDANFTISRGNPNLRPRVASNFDIGLEYYLPERNGLISVAAFYKDIKDEIFTLRDVQVIDGAQYQVTQPQNAQGSKVKGVEFGVIYNRFDFLPGPLANLGFSGNLTLVDGEIAYVDPRGQFATFDRLTEQSKLFGNASVFYNVKKFEARVSYNHWGGYYDSIPTAPQDSVGWADFETLDLSLRYDIDAHFKVKFKARNILGKNRVRTRGIGLSDLHEEVEFGNSFFLNLVYKY